MALWIATHKLFMAGLLLLAHGFYLAFTAREPLQAVHRGGTETLTVQIANVPLPVHIFVALVGVEAILGFMVAMFGFVPMMQLSAARASDQARIARYDQRMNTGTGFVHFNHRGTLAGRSSDASDNVVNELTKKMD